MNWMPEVFQVDFMDFDIIEDIKKNGYVILDTLQRKSLDSYMLSQGYELFVDGLNRQDIDLTVSLYEDTLAERPVEGVFHTDFSSHKNPPDYVVIECIKPDPRHPKYGFNQIVSVERLISELKSYDKNLFNNLKNLVFNFSVRSKEVSYCPFFKDESECYYMKYHPAYIENYDSLSEKYFYKGLRIIDFVEELALSICDELVLSTGQALITSNKYNLHRRGRCTIDFKDEKNNRAINTFRYIKR